MFCSRLAHNRGSFNFIELSCQILGYIDETSLRDFILFPYIIMICVKVGQNLFDSDSFYMTL